MYDLTEIKKRNLAKRGNTIAVHDETSRSECCDAGVNLVYKGDGDEIISYTHAECEACGREW